jgi:hypothetical protein
MGDRMSSRALAIVFNLSLGPSLGLSTLALAPPALADEAGRRSREVPGAGFSFLDAPPPAPPSLPPPPARESDEYPRRAWEGFPEVGLSAPFCRGDSFGVNHCGDSGTGTAVGGGALYRVSPYVGLGLEASFSRFELAVDGAQAAYSRASWVGFLVRGYFLERGAVEPYVETGVGRGSSRAGYSDGVNAVTVEASGPSALAGAGVDFWVTPYLRMGPALTYRWTLLTDVRSCVGSSCETASVADRGAVGSFASLSFVATLALGREM